MAETKGKHWEIIWAELDCCNTQSLRVCASCPNSDDLCISMDLLFPGKILDILCKAKVLMS